MTSSPAEIIFLVGPTAIGKTAVGSELARLIGGEIISCDSMQIYKYMDIITSKPAKSLRKRAKHHLIDFVSPAREYNVSRYRSSALGKIREVMQKGKTPLFVGGTGLYMSVLLDGIFKIKHPDKGIRVRLYKQAQRLGSVSLFDRLKTLDPQAASKIHPHDTRRLVRALEVFESTGKTISCLQKERRGIADKYKVKVFCLNMPREKLYERIDRRIEAMFKRGLLKEVKKLLGLKLSRTASYAIGIRELRDYFNGSYSLEEAKAIIKRNTRLYVKRQLTWFRRDKRVNWVQISGSEKPKDIARRIFAELRES